LISYQDTEVHTGTIYKAANWIPANRTKFASWNVSRERNSDQSTADKIRWEYKIKEMQARKEKIKHEQTSLI